MGRFHVKGVLTIACEIYTCRLILMPSRPEGLMKNVKNTQEEEKMFVQWINRTELISLYTYLSTVTWLQTGLELVTRFIDHLYTQSVTTSNYDSFTGLQVLKYNTHKIFCTFTSRFLVMDSNNVLCLFPYHMTNSHNYLNWHVHRSVGQFV
jgi:hypothetical protein